MQNGYVIRCTLQFILPSGWNGARKCRLHFFCKLFDSLCPRQDTIDWLYFLFVFLEKFDLTEELLLPAWHVVLFVLQRFQNSESSFLVNFFHERRQKTVIQRINYVGWYLQSDQGRAYRHARGTVVVATASETQGPRCDFLMRGTT
jgi:hypothetical protein